MPIQVTVRDQDAFQIAGKALEFVVYLPEETVSARELIRQRVSQEVAAYNAHVEEYFHGLVQPGDAERTLNGYRMRRRRPLDEQNQVEKAWQAFETNGFILLVDERQVEQLDQLIALRPESQVTFLKLVPLVGG